MKKRGQTLDLEVKGGLKKPSVKFNLPGAPDTEVPFRLDLEESPRRRSKVDRLLPQASSWSPGKTIKKFSLNDLPPLDEVFGDDVAMAKALGSILDTPTPITDRGKQGVKKVSKVPSLGSTSERLRDDLLQVSARVKGGLEADLGFGFGSDHRSPAGSTHRDGEGRRSKMLDKSLTSLQSRIQDQRRKFHELGSLTFSSSKIPPDLTDKKFTNPKNNFLGQRKFQEKAKLNEIARIFRKSLEASIPDPSAVIRIPEREKSPARNPSQLAKGRAVTKPVGKSFVGKANSLVTTTTGRTDGLMELRQLLERSPTKSLGPKLTESLLEVHDSQSRSKSGNKPPSVQFAEFLEETMNHELGKTASVPNQGGVQSKLKGSANKTIQDAGTLAKNLGSLVARVGATRTGRPDHDTLTEQEQMVRLTQEMNQVDGFGPNSADDGFGIEPFLSPSRRKPNVTKGKGLADIPTPSVFGVQKSQTQPLKVVRTVPGKTVEIQTATPPDPSPLNQPMKFLLPDITFTKDMTEADQKILQELRAMKSKWDLN